MILIRARGFVVRQMEKTKTRSWLLAFVIQGWSIQQVRKIDIQDATKYIADGYLHGNFMSLISPSNPISSAFINGTNLHGVEVKNS